MSALLKSSVLYAVGHGIFSSLSRYICSMYLVSNTVSGASQQRIWAVCEVIQKVWPFAWRQTWFFCYLMAWNNSLQSCEAKKEIEIISWFKSQNAGRNLTVWEDDAAGIACFSSLSIVFCPSGQWKPKKLLSWSPETAWTQGLFIAQSEKWWHAFVLHCPVVSPALGPSP